MKPCAVCATYREDGEDACPSCGRGTEVCADLHPSPAPRSVPPAPSVMAGRPIPTISNPWNHWGVHYGFLYGTFLTWGAGLFGVYLGLNFNGCLLTIVLAPLGGLVAGLTFGLTAQLLLALRRRGAGSPAPARLPSHRALSRAVTTGKAETPHLGIKCTPEPPPKAVKR